MDYIFPLNWKGTSSRVTTRLLGLIIVVFFPVTISFPLGMLVSCMLSVCCQNLIFSPVCGKDPFIYTKNDLALICCSCKSDWPVLKKKKKSYRIFTLPLNPARWNAGLVWLSHLCEERKTEWQWMQKLRFLAKVKEIWWYKCRSSMYAGTQCSGVLALTLPQELFPLNYAFRKAVGDTRQQYYTCISLPFFFDKPFCLFWKVILAWCFQFLLL